MAYTLNNHIGSQKLPSGIFFNAHPTHLPPHISNGQYPTVDFVQPQLTDFRIAPQKATAEDQELFLPLLEVAVDVEVDAAIAWTKLVQTFTNNATYPITEAKYCFPLYDGSAVVSFSCRIGTEKFLKGVVKPKEEAKSDYKEAVARNIVAALLEEHTQEVLETSLGNIPAQTTVRVEICYITELKADIGGDGLLVTIPTSVAPRYGIPPAGLDPNISSTVKPAENGLKIQVEVSSPVPIHRLESRTHPVSVELGSQGHPTSVKAFKALSTPGFDPKKARASLADRTVSLGKDFVLLIVSANTDWLTPHALLEPHPSLPDHSALMVSITPRDMFQPNVTTQESASEIIFVADRSGSMWDKLEALKVAMQVFLESLLERSMFNICSFGTKHTLLWRHSKPYKQKNVNIASSYIWDSFQADMGGTELLSALKSVVKQRNNKNINTEVIVITDGEVWQPEDTIEFVRLARAEAEERVRFFALGIGDAVSHQLVKGIGR
ncbi:hypothetical protein H2201_005915 [Coniosporium apollinis]|uniref:VIT domain-containing protein n=2 Tax=Coniosporium TaxID=2810619 RepID=A0ABQ9NPA3_9PEZI|nr:hypothetical protein H2199_006865 [Cladosporium sp. JES 115]KAJ9662834.1 hypothetical protein H2201_005915 [Coniosporium apollinis]